MEIVSAGVKRAHSPATSCTHDQLVKRLRLTKDGDGDMLPVELSQQPCLHCNGIGHAWKSCDGRCQQCQTLHPGHRCATLDAGFYRPAAFEVLQQTTDLEAAAATVSMAEGRRLYITNLADAVSEGDLQQFAGKYHIESIIVPTNPLTTKPVGYAFVDMAFPVDAQRAIEELDGLTFLDRKLHIQLVRKPADAAVPTKATAAGAATSTRLHVGNLALDATKKDLEGVFREYQIETLTTPAKPNGHPFGYAPVDASTITEAERAIKELSERAILDRKVSVQFATSLAGPSIEPADKPVAGQDDSFHAVNRLKDAEVERAIDELITEALLDRKITCKPPRGSTNVSAVEQIVDGLEPGEIDMNNDNCKPGQPPTEQTVAQVPTASLEGVSAERLAMIAVTPPEMPVCSEENLSGPRQTGMNKLPLGVPARSSLPPVDFLSDRQSSSHGSSSRRASVDVDQKVPQYSSQQVDAWRPKDGALQATRSMPAASHPADRLMGYDTTSAFLDRSRPYKKQKRTKAQREFRRRQSAPLPTGLSSHGPFCGMGDPAFPQSSGPQPQVAPFHVSQTGSHGLPMNGIGLGAPAFQQPCSFQSHGSFLTMTNGAIKQAARHKHGSAFGAQAEAIYSDLSQHVFGVVRGAQDPTRSQNNGHDSVAVDAGIRQALKILKPLILRPRVPISTQFSQVKMEH